MLPHHHHRGSHLALTIFYSLLHLFANFFKKIRILFHERKHFLPLRFRYVFHFRLQCLLEQETLEHSHLLFIVSSLNYFFFSCFGFFFSFFRALLPFAIYFLLIYNVFSITECLECCDITCSQDFSIALIQTIHDSLWVIVMLQSKRVTKLMC